MDEQQQASEIKQRGQQLAQTGYVRHALGLDRMQQEEGRGEGCGYFRPLEVNGAEEMLRQGEQHPTIRHVQREVHYVISEHPLPTDPVVQREGPIQDRPAGQ